MVAPRKDRTACILCGDYCRQGSPTLHHEDFQILSLDPETSRCTICAERLGLPRGVLDLFFGRSFSSMVGLFGFRVESKSGGAKVLLPVDK